MTENQRNWIGRTIRIKWGVSRGRDTAGYTTACLRDDAGKKWAACNGGGYDMRGTVLGDWIARAFPAELCAIPPDAMPEHSHWEPARNPRRICDKLDCLIATIDEADAHLLPPDTITCPKCGSETHADSQDGRTVVDGRYFYGLTFHDPNFDPGKALVGVGCDDRTLGQSAEGKTVAEAEAAGESVGLERYQAFYSASSKTPTTRHTVPLIDGACGESSVMRILNAIGLGLRQLVDRRNEDIYEVIEHKTE